MAAQKVDGWVQFIPGIKRDWWIIHIKIQGYKVPQWFTDEASAKKRAELAVFWDLFGEFEIEWKGRL